MMNSTQQLYLSHLRLRDLQTAEGHALPSGLSTLTICTEGGICFVPVAFVAQGGSVPSSRRGPPLLYE
jgi:hypothetical protein